MTAIDAWLFVAAVFGVLYVWWRLLMLTLHLLDRAREGSAPYRGEAEDSPRLTKGTGTSGSR